MRERMMTLLSQVKRLAIHHSITKAVMKTLVLSPMKNAGRRDKEYCLLPKGSVAPSPGIWHSEMLEN